MTHDETGLLVDERDVQGLAGAVARLRGDHALGQRLSAAAIEHVRRNFSWPAITDRIINLYSSLT